MPFNPLHQYDTVEDLARAVNQMSPMWGNESKKKQANEFCEFSWDETMEHAIKGWPKGKDYMQKVVDSIKSGAVFAPLPSYSLDVAGAYPVAAIAAAGDPFCMIEPRRDLSKNRPVLTFRLNLGMNCNWTSEQVYNYGGALLAWMDQLETSGFSIEIEGYFYGKGNDGYTIRTLFGVKKAGQPFDLNRLAFGLVHTGPLRRFEFMLIEQYPELRDNGFSYGYGKSTVMNKTERKKQGMENDDVIWMEGRDTHFNSKCSTAHGALMVLKDQIKKGCEEAGVLLDVDSMIIEKDEEKK